MHYYNDNDPKCCAWLNELIKAKLIPEGVIDVRSITKVDPEELRDYTQCHFFAGIGGWSYALRLAGWPEDEPVWTGSCPCQPLSSAGQRKGHADERHLWPTFYNLIAKCKPATVFGEQVAGVDGREWLSGIRADLEGAGYACGCADLCAAGVSAPHIRQRLFWVAHTTKSRRQGENRTKQQECRPWSPNSILCLDGKIRRIPSEPALFPLAHGIPGRVGLLRGAGNAIVPQVAEKFIQAFMSIDG